MELSRFSLVQASKASLEAEEKLFSEAGTAHSGTRRFHAIDLSEYRALWRGNPAEQCEHCA